MSDSLHTLSMEKLRKYFDQTSILGKQLFFYNKIDSTNDEAQRLIKKDFKRSLNGAVIVSMEQTSGRGTKGANWFSPAKMGLYTSIILYPKASYKLSDLTNLSYVVGDEMVKILKGSISKQYEIKLKKPNDILVCNKKVIGILCESSSCGNTVSHIVIGFGINFSRPLEKIPQSLEEKIGFLNEFIENGSSIKIYKNIIFALDELIYFYTRDITCE